MHCPGLVPGLSSLGLRTHPCICSLPCSQPHPDEGHPPPLEAVPVPWKSVGPCKSHRESLGGLPETPAGEEAQGEEGAATTQLDVSRLRSSSMEIREKGSEFLKEELHKAQKVGTEGGARRVGGGGARHGVGRGGRGNEEPRGGGCWGRHGWWGARGGGARHGGVGGGGARHRVGWGTRRGGTGGDMGWGRGKQGAGR